MIIVELSHLSLLTLNTQLRSCCGRKTPVVSTPKSATVRRSARARHRMARADLCMVAFVGAKQQVCSGTIPGSVRLLRPVHNTTSSIALRYRTVRCVAMRNACIAVGPSQNYVRTVRFRGMWQRPRFNILARSYSHNVLQARCTTTLKQKLCCCWHCFVDAGGEGKSEEACGCVQSLPDVDSKANTTTSCKKCACLTQSVTLDTCECPRRDLIVFYLWYYYI